MPPQVALLLCICFILVVIAIDTKRKSVVSRALWIPLLWMMIIGSRFVSQWLNFSAPVESPDYYLEGSPIDRTVFMLLMVVGLFILSRRKIEWSKVMKSNVWLFLMFFYFGVSILWSDFPVVSLKRWIKAIGDLIMILIVLTESDPAESIKSLFKRCAYVLIPLSILFIKYYPHLGRTYVSWTGTVVTFTGVATNKNSLGALCLVCGLFFFWNLQTMWLKRNINISKKEVFVHVLFLCMIVWLLKLSDSATSLATFIIGVCIFIWTELPKVKRNKIHIKIFIVFLILLLLQISFDIKNLFISILGRETTLTGRTDLWKELINMGTNPFIGTGYESFWLGSRLKKIWLMDNIGIVNQAHNGYLEIYLNLGLIGLFFVIGVIITTYKKIGNTLIRDFDFGRFRLTFLIIFIFYNITENSFRPLSPLWFIFLLIAVKCPQIWQSQNFRENLEIAAQYSSKKPIMA